MARPDLQLIKTPERPPRKSARAPALVTITCAVCDEKHGEFAKKDIPASFVCTKCGTGQKTGALHSNVGHSHKRNYPEGYFDQN